MRTDDNDLNLIYSTFEEAARNCGLIAKDGEWDLCL
jgi:hypothetical protein